MDAKPVDKEGKVLKRLVFSVIWFVIFIFYLSSAGSTNYLSLFYSLFLVVPLRFFSDKNNKKTTIKDMFYRILHIRKYRTRLIRSGALFGIFFLLSLGMITSNIKSEKAPSPIIEILSQSGNIGNATSYTLIYKTKNTKQITIGEQVFHPLSGENMVDFSLSGFGNNKLDILIIATNGYKTIKETISIFRNKTQEEIDTEKKEQERVANEEAQKKIDIIDGYIKNIDLSGPFYTVESIKDVLNSIQLSAEFLKVYLEDNNTKVVNKAKEEKTFLINKQKELFPKLRKSRCDIADSVMWEYDVDVKCYGTTAKFIGGIYASNKNIKDSYLAIEDLLYLLRFKKANFYRYEGSDYTSITIDSPGDNILK